LAFFLLLGIADLKADVPAGRPAPAAVDGARPGADGLVAQRDGEKKEDRGRGEAGDKKEGEPRDGDEGPRRRDAEKKERDVERPKPEGEARSRELGEKRRQLEERAQAVKRQLGELGEAGGEKAEKLRGELREIQEAGKRLEDEARQIMERRGPQPPEREQVQGRLEELRQKIGQLIEAGRYDDAERLKREGREMIERMQERLRPEERRRPEGPVPPEELQRRIHHLKAAIENLHAAGMHDQAEQLAQHVERMIEEHRQGAGERPEGSPRPEGPRPEGRPRPEGPPRPDGPPRFEGQDRVFPELRGEIDRMRREMQEMREQLRKLLERDREK
jgi:chromosome segregation ATPase